MFLNLTILFTVVIAAVALWHPRLRRSATWRAMITPLASIIGSGFLVLGPILEQSFGAYAPLVMISLCLLAWSFGQAIRDNIAAIENQPRLEKRPAETVASVLLGFAFTISVAYYLNLFGAFALSLTPFDSMLNARLMTSAVYGVILIVGVTRGFAMLERMEYASVALKLAIIAGLLIGLASYNVEVLAEGGHGLRPTTISGWAAITLIFGLIVTVQGFETSRYLGKSYDPATRITSMRWAQLLSTVIYVVYICLIAYAFDPGHITLSETAIVDMMGIVAPILPPLLVAAALAAQFSAAVADTGGSGGLIAELTRGRLPEKRAYVAIVAIGLALTWFADVFEIISYASRAFAAYYAVQAGIAAVNARHAPTKAVFFVLLTLLGAAIALLGQPVE